MTAKVISIAEYRERRALRRPRAEMFVMPVAVFIVTCFYVAMAAWLKFACPVLAHATPLVHLPF